MNEASSFNDDYTYFKFKQILMIILNDKLEQKKHHPTICRFTQTSTA